MCISVITSGLFLIKFLKWLSVGQHFLRWDVWIIHSKRNAASEHCVDQNVFFVFSLGWTGLLSSGLREWLWCNQPFLFLHYSMFTVKMVCLAPSSLPSHFTVEKQCSQPSGMELLFCKWMYGSQICQPQVDRHRSLWLGRDERNGKRQREGGVKMMWKWSEILRREGWDKSRWCSGSCSCASLSRS